VGVPIRYKVPYRITVRAVDLGSGKAISNSWYYKTEPQTVAPPAYGGIIAGSGDTNTLLTNFVALFGPIRALLNHNYQTVDYTASALTGKRYSTAPQPIAGLTVNALSVSIINSVPHGLINGSVVNVYGVSAPTGVNGVWAVQVDNPTTFTIPATVTPAPWTGDGYWQRATGEKEFILSDTTTDTSVGAGSVLGDALPLFATASVRRLNSGFGRNFRSRVSLGPMSESDSLDGTWVAGTKAAWITALAGFFVGNLSNGGTDPGSSSMFDIAVSQKIAMGLATPFTQSDTWTAELTGYRLQPNAGSLVRRKPRLTAPIA